MEKLIEYIGDGVYVEYDGFGIWLLANDHLAPTDKIYLEPEVLEALNRFLERIKDETSKTKDSQKMAQPEQMEDS